jgi:hypothetical protein
MARTAWTLTDNSSGSPVVLTFDINPSDAEYPGRQANLIQESGSSPVATPIVFQGRDALPSLSFTGRVRGQTSYGDFDTWKDKWYPLVLTDDLSNSWTVLIRSWNFTRLRRHVEPWTFEVKAEFMVLP